MRLSDDFFTRHFGDLWPIHNRGFTAILIECRRLCGGDLEQALILSAIGERTLTPERARGISYGEFLEGKRADGTPRVINTQSIADSTGIPRETVRRKIGLLVERGWLKRKADGSFEVTEAAGVDLADATRATFDYLSAIGNAVIARLQDEPGEAERDTAVDR